MTTRPDVASWLRVVALTPDRWGLDETVGWCDAVLDGGVTAVTVREARLDDDAFTEVAVAVAERCRAHGAACLVSRRLDAARAAEADAVHAGWDGPSIAAIRAAGFVAGRSAHWPLTDEDHAADYVTLSPFRPTHRSHPRPLLEPGQVHDALAMLDAPVVALGGLGLGDVSELPEGLAGVAVIRALADAPDPRGTAAQLRALVDARLDFGGR